MRGAVIFFSFRDIDLSERDQFWKKVEAEEASRRVEERRRANQRDAEADRDKAELSKQIHERLHVEENAHNVHNANNLNDHPPPNVGKHSFVFGFRPFEGQLDCRGNSCRRRESICKRMFFLLLRHRTSSPSLSCNTDMLLRELRISRMLLYSVIG